MQVLDQTLDESRDLTAAPRLGRGRALLLALVVVGAGAAWYGQQFAIAPKVTKAAPTAVPADPSGR